jgi:hypothetical protein
MNRWGRYETRTLISHFVYPDDGKVDFVKANAFQQRNGADLAPLGSSIGIHVALKDFIRYEQAYSN